MEEKKLNCWEYHKCGREPGGVNVKKDGVCPAASLLSLNGANSGKNAGRMCWVVGGTFCGSRVQGDFAKKYSSCMECEFFKKVKEEEKTTYKFLVPGQEFEQVQKLFGDFTDVLKELQLHKHHVEEFNKKLEVMIAEKTQELQLSQQKLRQTEKMAAVGQLASGFAHEINNPMTVILGFSQFVAGQVKEDNLFYMPLKSIESEAERCKKLIQSLLTFSRVSKTNEEMLDINKSIENALSLAEVKTKMGNINIEKDLDPKLPNIMADSSQIQQIVINLCNNAADAMPQGGTIKVSTGQNAGYLEIIISDTGMGIAKEVIGKIFDPFFTTKEVGKGTGLGLSLCYEIVQKYKGEIAVESELKKGTSFIIRLPLK